MMQFFKIPRAKEEDYEALYRELRRTMQDIVIAHAQVAYRHMNSEQFAAVQADWATLVKGKGWAGFFSDEAPGNVAPTPRWRSVE